MIKFSLNGQLSCRKYEIWENQPAPNKGHDFSIVKAGGVPFDQDWEEWSYPIGNGYMGANLFGRLDTERIQITEKTLHNKGIYNGGGLTSFAELYLDFGHQDSKNYRRSLNLNEAISYVYYESDGVKYSREYFMSYPDKVLVIKLSANQKGKLSFTVRPEIPYLERSADTDQRSGEVVAENDLLTLSGQIPYFKVNYEGQIKILNEGGSLESKEPGQITVTNADSVLLLAATGTNYRLSEKIFSSPDPEKLDGNLFPHDDVNEIIKTAAKKDFEKLKRTHLEDYQNLFNRVKINLNSEAPKLPTSELLQNYQAGEKDNYLEELMFQFARYLLIASSRENTLPSGLQGVWSQYQYTPWTGGYWHNINVQMNYWGALSANLAETFEAYINYFKAYYPKATEYATDYVRQFNPQGLSEEPEGNGWIIGTGANAYNISGAGGGHSGPGTGGFTSKLLMEYYYYTGDRAFLEKVAYPALLSMSRFFSKALIPGEGNLLLVHPSASPEQKVRDEKQVIGKPGHVDDRGNYITDGCTFDQGFVWENHNDTLIAAEILGKQDEFLDVIRDEINRLDPILIGDSGQIKEYREETVYSEIGEEHHRHISHLCPLYPGSLINSDHEDWMEAAAKTLELRGNKTTGWAMAHRMNCLARLKAGEKAHAVFQKFISERTVPNLWTLHLPFQIDGNFGTMAGVSEMLMQSHEDYIELLPALPKAWQNGSFDGLVARGNFVLSTEWGNGEASSFTVTSRMGGECSLKYPGIHDAVIKDSDGNVIKASHEKEGHIAFSASQSKTYTIKF